MMAWEVETVWTGDTGRLKKRKPGQDDARALGGITKEKFRLRFLLVGAYLGCGPTGFPSIMLPSNMTLVVLGLV